MTIKGLLLLLLCLVVTHPAWAQDLTPVASQVGITADVLEYHQDQKQYLAIGNAEVEQNGVKISAAKLTANYIEGPDGKNTFTTVFAEGGVHITSSNGEVFGERGIYDVARQVAVLKGNNLKLVAKEDVVTATDSLEFWQKEQLAVARGGAVAKRADREIRADRLTALLANNAEKQMEIKRIAADGHVTITTTEEVAKGQRGVYDVALQKANLYGDVSITRGKNQLVGQRAEVNLATGVSRLLAGSGQRVRGLIVPKDAPEVK